MLFWIYFHRGQSGETDSTSVNPGREPVPSTKLTETSVEPADSRNALMPAWTKTVSNATLLQYLVDAMLDVAPYATLACDV